ncbi:MAG: hypothetical protein F6K31_09875 [Symploca sp. SIO2G7]|nr:hypothetical protein [Symploca sp. SIO2G7]
MNADTKFTLLVLGLPLGGLVYCALGVALMILSPTVREHPLVSGMLFLLIPLAIATSIWIRASAKAYQSHQ